jgi:hypothetical protein
MAIHCWNGERDWIEKKFGYLSEEHLKTYEDSWSGGTCMLEDGHEGDCDFTPSDEIVINFAPNSKQGASK